MRIAPVTTTVKSKAPDIQASLPTEQTSKQKDREVQQSVKNIGLPDLEEMASDMQKNLSIMHNVNLRFSVHKDSGRMMVTVVDETTGEVIREIPSQEILDLAAKMDEMVGMIFDQKG